MILSRRVSLHGVQMDSLDSSIVIRNVSYGAPKETVNAVSRIGGVGQRITSRHWDTLDIAVSYAIDLPKTSQQSRRTVYEKVCAWALPGGWLELGNNYRRRAWIEQTILQDPEDFRDWTKDFVIVFRAYSIPFWQDSAMAIEYKSAYDGTAFNMTVPGQVRTVIGVSYKNTSGSAMTAFSITVGNNTIALTDINVADNETLVITHDEAGLLKIYTGTTSWMDKRTAASSDDLYADPGTVSVQATTSAAGNMTVNSYGRYA